MVYLRIYARLKLFWESNGSPVAKIEEIVCTFLCFPAELLNLAVRQHYKTELKA